MRCGRASVVSDKMVFNSSVGSNGEFVTLDIGGLLGKATRMDVGY